jgi:hypothetical protein
MAISNQAQIQKLVTVFTDAVISQTEAIRQGNPGTGNKHAKRYIAAFKKLRSLGNAGRDALIPLLAHSRADVREMAAVYLLRYKTKEAIEVLQSEGAGVGLVAFGAQQAIKRWQEGAWNLDPP